MVAGITLGALWPSVGQDLKPLADGFIKLIRMIISPLVFCVVVNGIASVGNAKAVGRIGLKTIVYFEVVTTFALLFGVVVADVFKPGVGFHIDPATLAKGDDAIAAKTGGAHIPGATQFILNMIPESVVKAFADNTLLAVLVFSVLFGLALGRLPHERTRILRGTLEQLSEVLFALMGFIMKVSPLGALGAMAYIIGLYGMRTLQSFAALVACCYAAGAMFIVILWAIARFYAGVSLWSFVKFCKDEFLLALGTASTETVLPRVMTKLVQSGNSQSVTGLVVPTGYSFNMDGATIYLAIASIFLSQAFGVHTSLAHQLTMIGVLTFTSKGTAGMPGTSFLALAATATALGAYPVAGVALLLGADRLMDSQRVVVNLLGNCVATFVISRSEGALDRERMARAFAGHPDDIDDIVEADLEAADAAPAGPAAAPATPANATTVPAAPEPGVATTV